MLRIVNLEEIERMLLRVPALVDLQDRGNPDFAQDVKQWLSELEKVLESNRIAVAGTVAALRALVISAERGVIPVGVEFHGRPTRRKIQEAAGAYVLRQSGDLVSSVTQRERERVAEAERLTRQLVALAKAKGLIQEVPSGGDFTEILKGIWRTLSADPDISGGTVNVEGLVGPYDALIVLDRIITSDIGKE